MDGKMAAAIGFAILMLAFLTFFFYVDIAPAIVLLAVGVIFVTAGGIKRGAGAHTPAETPLQPRAS